MPTLILDGDARGAVRATTDLARGLERITGAAAKTGLLMDEQGRKTITSLAGQRQAFDSVFTEGRAQLAGMIGSYASLVGGILLVTKSLRDQEREAQRAADAVLNTLGSIGQLQQLPDFALNAGLARQLIRRGVVSNTEQATAYDIIYDLKSAALNDEDIAYVTEVGAQKFVKSKDLAQYGGALKKYQSTFGEAEAGSIPQVVSKIAVAAEIAQADAVQVAIATTNFGSEAHALGMSDEAAVAAFLAVEGKAPSPDEAATRVRAFLSQLDRRHLWKGNLADTVANIDSQIAGGKSAYDVLGEIRAVAGYRNISGDMPFIAKTERKLMEANYHDLIAGPAPIMQDPSYAAAIVRQQSEGELAYVDEQQESTRENLFSAAMAAHKAGMKKRGRYEGPGQVEMMLWKAADLIGAEGLVLREQMVEERVTGRGDFSPELQTQINNYLHRQTKAVEDINTKTRSVPLRGGRQE